MIKTNCKAANVQQLPTRGGGYFKDIFSLIACNGSFLPERKKKKNIRQFPRFSVSLRREHGVRRASVGEVSEHGCNMTSEDVSSSGRLDTHKHARWQTNTH